MWETDEIGYIFWEGLLLGGSNAENWGDHKKKKLFINNSVDNVKHQGLLKHVLPLSTQ